MLGRGVCVIALLLVSGCSQDDAENGAQASKSMTEPSPTAVIERPPELAEAQAAGAKCGVEVKYYDGLGRPALWAVYLPVDATAEQEKCYFSSIRQMLSGPTEASVE